jgi:UDP-N-acetylglucosamine--N-acetylmuramyl-(pentapeptide) pyrophosphoryl-undecaprenol N-acetylglucosamine transferase
MEAELIRRTGLPFRAIPAAGVHGVGLRTLPGNLVKLLRGYFASRKILREFTPDVILFTGGFVSIPMALAANKVPSLLYIPDIEPGLALKTLSKYADTIAITTDATRRYYPTNTSKLILTGYPTRASFAGWTREKARHRLKLASDQPVFLALGGSKGARSINRAILQVLDQLLKVTQVIHISGQLDWEEVSLARAGLPQTLRSHYRAFAYLHEDMGAALAAADLVLSRAGASTLGEYPLFGLPAILVPYPHAWRYQKVNADYLVEKGAAFLLEDEKLPSELLATVMDLLFNQRKLHHMASAMKKVFIPGAAQAIGRLLSDLAKKGAG